MKIKTIESHGINGDEKVNAFINGKKVINITTNTIYIPQNLYGDGRSCYGYVLYTYTIAYEE